MSRAIMILITLVLGLALVVGSCAPAAPTQTPAEFYKGKTVELVVSAKPGGGDDLTARVIAKYLPQKLGASVVVVNKYASKNEGSNYVWQTKPDGLTLCCEEVAAPVLNDIFDEPGFLSETEKMIWLGAIADEVFYFWVSATGPIKSPADLMAGKKLKFVSTTPMGSRSLALVTIAHCLDLDAKVIAGFAGSKECDLAIMRGEATGTTSTYSSYTAGVKAGTHRGLITMDLVRSPLVPELPALAEVVKLSKEKTEFLRLQRSILLSKGFYVTPGTPKDRVAFLRTAFTEVTKLPEARAELEKVWYPGVPVIDAERLTEIVKEIKKREKELVREITSLLEKYRG